jgi:hypothetical protein
MRQELSQHLSTELEQRLELRQELQQELVQIQEALLLLQKDFYIKLEMDSDEDWDVLKESMPFLVMHELSHPPLDKYRSKFTYYDHNAKEVCVDGFGLESAVRVCGYTLGEIVDSHAALAGRVFKDAFEQQKIDPDPKFLARIVVELEVHSSETKKPGVQELADRFDKKCAEAFGECYTAAKDYYKKTYLDARRITKEILE